MSEDKKPKVWPMTYQSILDDFKKLPDALENCSNYYFDLKGKKLFHEMSTILDNIQFTRVIFIGNTYNYFASFIPKYCFMKTKKEIKTKAIRER